MTALSPTSAVVDQVATRRTNYDVEADRRDAIAKAIEHLVDGDRGRAHYLLVRATQRCARLTEHDVDLVEAWALFCAAFDRQIEMAALRSLRRQGGRRG